MRSKKILLNSSVGLIYQAVNMICGFVLPWLILTHFGSNYNGIIASLMQFLNTIVLLRAGISGVTKAALYKPLADNNNQIVSEIIQATKLFMQKVAIIFAFGIICFAIIYPLFVKREFEWLFTFSLVLIMGLNIVIQNYFGITYQILLLADQRNYIYSVIQIITAILNTIVTVILIFAGFNIQIVMLGSTIVFILNPVLLILYVRKRYHIIKGVELNYSLISQRWSAFTQEIAVFVNNNTPIMMLTIFSNLKEVSVYTVYHLVINGVRTLITSLSGGFGAALGNMIARKEEKVLQQSVRLYEFFLFTFSTIFFTSTALLIVPFVMVYTNGVSDVNYDRPLFGYLATLCIFFYCVRLPYDDLVEAMGHFKQTRNGAIIESFMNIIISIIFVRKFGIIGVTVGTLCAMVFRTVQYAVYSSKYILNRSINVVIKRIIASLFEAVTIIFVVTFIPSFEISNYFMWGLRAIEVFMISVIVVFCYKFVFYKNDLRLFINKVFGMFKRI